MGVRICFCFPGGSVIKTLPVSAEDVSLIPGLGRSSGEGNGNPLQYSCLGNPMERGARWAVVYGVINKLDTIWRLNNSICFCSSWQLLLICLPWENLYWIPTPTDLSQQASKETQSLVSEYITWNISVLSSGKKKKKNYLIQNLCVCSVWYKKLWWCVPRKRRFTSSVNLSWAVHMLKAWMDLLQLAAINFLMVYSLRKGASFPLAFSAMSLPPPCLAIMWRIDWTQLDSSCSRDTWRSLSAKSQTWCSKLSKFIYYLRRERNNWGNLREIIFAGSFQSITAALRVSVISW